MLSRFMTRETIVGLPVGGVSRASRPERVSGAAPGSRVTRVYSAPLRVIVSLNACPPVTGFSAP